MHVLAAAAAMPKDPQAFDSFFLSYRELLFSPHQYSTYKTQQLSAGLSLVQFRELLGNRRINELSLRFRVGSLTFCGGTSSSVQFVKK